MGKRKTKKKNDEESKSGESKDEVKKDKKKKAKKEKKTPEVKDVTPVVKVIDTKAMVDQYVPNRNQYHIYPDDDFEFNGKYFTCTLNKSDLDKNNNKFYLFFFDFPRNFKIITNKIQ